MATRVASIVADIGINTKNFDKGIQSVIKSLGLAKGDFAKFGVALGVAGVAIGAVYSQMRKAVDITVTYADEVRTLSSVTNQSAEKTSKMIQVLDDFKISSQQAGSAARFLAKEGLSLNVETLAKLSDQYKALNTGQEKATFLMKNFGKAGQDFALVMDQGSEAILKQGDAVNKGLILTEKQLKQARDLEIAQDELNDIMQEYNVIIGNAIIPVQMELIRGVIDLTKETNNLNKEERIRLEMMEKEKKISKGRVEVLDAMNARMQEFYKSTALAADATETLDMAMSSIGDSGAEMAAAMYQAKLAADGVLDEQDVQNVLNFRETIGLLTEEERRAAQTAIDLGKVILNLPAEKTITVTTWYLSGYGQAGAYAGGVRTQQGSTRRAAGGPLGSGFTLVGEAGPELIGRNGMVINAHNTRRMLGRGMVPGRRMAVGAKMIPDPWEPRNNSSGGGEPDAGSVFWVPGGGGMYSPGSPGIGDFTAPWSSGGGGGSSAVIRTAAAASQSASAAAKETSRAVDVTAQMSQQAAISSAQQAASLASIDRRLANLPGQIRDAFQQVIQQ